MKKLKLLLILGLGIAIGIAAACLAYYSTIADIEWNDFIENTVVPTVLMALTSIASIYAIVSPIIKRTNNTLSSFNAVSEDVSSTAVTGRKLNTDIALYSEKLDTFMKKTEQELAVLKSDMDTTKSMTSLAFCNMDELVKKGIAHEIADLEEGYGEKQQTA